MYVLLNHYDFGDTDTQIVGLYESLQDAQNQLKECVECSKKDYFDNKEIEEESNSLMSHTLIDGITIDEYWIIETPVNKINPKYLA